MLHGLKEFRQFLSNQRSEMASNPVLIVGSAMSSTANTSRQGNPPELLKHVQLYCSSVGLRTTTAHASSEHFPFAADISSTIEFAKRTGAGTVVGVGGSGALELAKAVSQEGLDFERLILVPENYGTALFASASRGLMLDPNEPALLPHPSKTTALREVQSHIVLSDLANPAKEDAAIVRSTAYAGLVLALDTLYRGVGTETEEDNVANIKLASDLIDKLNDDPWNDGKMLAELMMGTGSSVSFGLSITDTTIRSIPLALSSSLLPTAFPDYDFLGFISCLLPGVLSTLEGTKHNDLAMELSSRFLYRCPRIAKSPGDDLDVQTLLSHVHDNIYLWDCNDTEDAVLKQVLHASLM